MIRSRRVRSHPGFTLVEMLVTITILAILVAFVYGAMSAAETTAKITKTKATIAKLHRLIMARYESFKTRRIPIDLYSRSDGSPISPAFTLAEMAQVRLDAIREIMRQELPETLTDISNGPDRYPMSGPWQKLPTRYVPPTSIFQAYYDYMQQMNAENRRNNGLITSAECLYLIVTLSCPGGREQFSENEIGDTDSDGWPEFIDGWGRPIFFLRWAPRFISIPPYNADSLLQTGNATLQHDPFDTQNIQPTAYQLIPLIYSCGPDGESHIIQDGSYASRLLNSGRRDPYVLTDGQPGDASNSRNTALKHFDNIHNHRLEVR